MWPLSTEAATALFERERREFSRQIVGEEGELFIPVEDMAIPCVVENISAGGAKISCDIVPPTGTALVLRFKGNAIAATLAWYNEDACGLSFTAPAGLGK